ncbi:hypothetical protein ACFS07_31110 [Undibacterium arcticum]
MAAPRQHHRRNQFAQSHQGVQSGIADASRHPLSSGVRSRHFVFFSKAIPAVGDTNADTDEVERYGDNVILVAINLDPFSTHSAHIEVPLWGFGLADDAQIDVEDLVHDTHFRWHGKHQQVTLDPFTLPFAIWRLSSTRSTGSPRSAGA